MLQPGGGGDPGRKPGPGGQSDWARAGLRFQEARMQEGRPRELCVLTGRSGRARRGWGDRSGVRSWGPTREGGWDAGRWLGRVLGETGVHSFILLFIHSLSTVKEAGGV